MKNFFLVLLCLGSSRIASAQLPADIEQTSVIEQPTGQQVFDVFTFLVDLQPYFQEETVTVLTYYRESETVPYARLGKATLRTTKMLELNAQHLGHFLYLVQCDCLENCYLLIEVNVERIYPLRKQWHCPS